MYVPSKFQYQAYTVKNAKIMEKTDLKTQGSVVFPRGPPAGARGRPRGARGWPADEFVFRWDCQIFFG